MWQQIQDNKRKSLIVIFATLVFMIITGAIFAVLAISYFDISETYYGEEKTIEIYLYAAMFGAIGAIIIWLIQLIAAFKAGKDIFMSMNNATKIPKGAHKVLENVVEEMSIAAGMPKPPQIYVIDTAMPNAFATGISPDKSAVAVTVGLLTELNRDELQGVIAHEISHIVNRDTMYMIIAGIMIGTISIIAEIGLRVFARGSSRRSSSKDSGGIILIICLLFMLLAPLFANLLYFSLSRKREYLADASAVQFTRFPQGLASALFKISQSSHEYKDVNNISSAMYIVNPLKDKQKKQNFRSMFDNAFSTHPSTENRIAVLNKMASADLVAYNQAFSAVSASYSSRKMTILSKSELKNIKPIEIIAPLSAGDMPLNINHGLVENNNDMLINQQVIQDKQELKQRKRDAEDIIWKSENYIFKECSCGTKLKFPKEYQGQVIPCPHCQQNIIVSNV